MKKQHQFLLPAIVVTAMLIGAVLLLRHGNQSSDHKTVTLAAVLPMTGEQAFSGQEQSRGLSLAIEKLNSSKVGPQFALILEDSKGQPKDGAAAISKLMSQEKAVAVFTSLTGVSRAIIPLIPPERAVVIAFGMDESLSNGGASVMRIYPGIREEGNVITAILKHLDSKRIGIVSFNQEAINAQVDSVILPYLSSVGAETISERFSSADGGSLRLLVEKLRAFHPDALVVNAYYNQMPGLIAAISESGFDRSIPLIGGLNLAMAIDRESSLPQLPEEVYIAMPLYLYRSHSGTGTPEYTEFSAKYLSKWHQKPTLDSAFAYDAAVMLGNAILQTDRSAQSIPHAMQTLGQHEGATGLLQMDASRSSHSQWQPVRFVKANGSASPRYTPLDGDDKSQ